MDQRELVRSGNGKTQDAYTIVMVMHLSNADNLIEESKVFKSIAIDWFNARKESAEKINLIAVSDPMYHKAIKDLFIRLHGMEINLRPVFEKIPLEIAFHNSEAKLIESIELLPSSRKKKGFLAKFLGGLK